MAWSPLSILQILGFDMKLAARKNLGRRAHFGRAVCVAFHVLVRDEFPISWSKVASSYKAIRGEIVKGNHFTLLIPDQQGFAAIRAVIDRMKESDGLAIERAFPPFHIDGRLIEF